VILYSIVDVTYRISWQLAAFLFLAMCPTPLKEAKSQKYYEV
jgi:hypothetical protein